MFKSTSQTSMKRSSQSRAGGGLRAEILSPELLAELKRLELRTRRSLSADIMGNYRSAFRGSGLVFADTREYEPGDDIKAIHWKATARSQKVYVKSYHEDRSIEVLVCVDISASTQCSPPSAGEEDQGGKSLHRKAFEIAASLVLLAQQSGDAVGLMLFGQDVQTFERPRGGRRAVEHLLLTLLRGVELREGTNISVALTHALKYQRKRSVVFLISDFFSPDFEGELAQLSRRHEVVLVYLEPLPIAHVGSGAQDSTELPLADMGLVRMRDPETAELAVVDTSSRVVMRALAKRLEGHWQRLASIARAHQVDLVRIRGSRVLQPLVELMHRRQVQRGGGRSHVVGA